MGFFAPSSPLLYMTHSKVRKNNFPPPNPASFKTAITFYKSQNHRVVWVSHPGLGKPSFSPCFCNLYKPNQQHRVSRK